jgi:hypothetical protein
MILTPEFGQSQKLINVWTAWEPLPRLAHMPDVSMTGIFWRPRGCWA